MLPPSSRSSLLIKEVLSKFKRLFEMSRELDIIDKVLSKSTIFENVQEDTKRVYIETFLKVLLNTSFRIRVNCSFSY